jgi:hypothetical protein
VVTNEQLDTYEAFAGDVDAWARAGAGRGMTDADWRLIEELRQGLHLVSAGLASTDFAARFEERLSAVTLGEGVRARLRTLVAAR